jgi:3-hydroxyacyl-CoA dehydrogenase
MTARYETRDGRATVTLDNPPVNGLSLATRKAVAESIERAQRDPAVVAIVLTGAGRAFCAGADIREFGTPQATQAPSLWTTLEAIESSPKPVVAATRWRSARWGAGFCARRCYTSGPASQDTRSESSASQR